MIALDANILIALQDRTDPMNQTAADIITNAISNDEGLCVSALTLAEALVHRAALGTASQAFAQLAALEVTIEPIAATQVLQLAQLRAQTKLRLPDVVVLALASEVGALATCDRRLAKAAKDVGVERVLPQE